MITPLQTKRLCIREFEAKDSAKLFQLYQIPETSEYESWEPFQSELVTRDLLNDWIIQQSKPDRREFTLAITRRHKSPGERELIGLCGLDLGTGIETDDATVGFLSYRLFPDYWRQGIATEALQELLRWGFQDLKLHRMHSGCAAGNIASSRVLQKAGMRLEGRTRKSFPIAGQWSDYLLYGILNEEYPIA